MSVWHSPTSSWSTFHGYDFDRAVTFALGVDDGLRDTDLATDFTKILLVPTPCKLNFDNKVTLISSLTSSPTRMMMMFSQE